MAKPNPEQIGNLVADVVEYNHRKENEYFPDDENTITSHGLKKQAVTGALSALRSHWMILDSYPNFVNLGFTSEAFIDITLNLQNSDGIDEPEIRKSIMDDLHVVSLYTVFGEVDLRCKVVGFNTKDIEETATRIKSLPGIASSKTFIVIEETDFRNVRKKSSDLIRQNVRRVGAFVQQAREGSGESFE